MLEYNYQHTGIKIFFNKKYKKELTDGMFTLSDSIDSIGTKEYKTISEAIEATDAKKFYIHQKMDNKLVCKGLWINYTLQNT